MFLCRTEQPLRVLARAERGVLAVPSAGHCCHHGQGKGLASRSRAACPAMARGSARALRAARTPLSSRSGSWQSWDLFLPRAALQEGCQGNLSPWCLHLLIRPSRRHPQTQKGTFPFYCLCSLPATDLHNSIIVYKHLISFTLPQ